MLMMIIRSIIFNYYMRNVCVVAAAHIDITC